MTPHFLNLDDEVIFHKSQDNFIRFIVMPLFRELEDFNQISLRLKYAPPRKSLPENVFQSDAEDSISDEKASAVSKDSILPQTQQKILGKLSRFREFIQILETNWARHQALSKPLTH